MFAVEIYDRIQRDALVGRRTAPVPPQGTQKLVYVERAHAIGMLLAAKNDEMAVPANLGLLCLV